jgi:hypothetical protein
MERSRIPQARRNGFQTFEKICIILIFVVLFIILAKSVLTTAHHIERTPVFHTYTHAVKAGQ